MFLNAMSVVFAEVATASANPNAQTHLDPAKLDEQQIKQIRVEKTLYKLIAAYQRAGDMQRLTWALQRFTQLYPNNGDAKMQLAATYAVQGKKSETYDLLLRTQKQGYGYDLTNDKRFDKVADTEVWKYVVDNLKANLKPFGQGSVAFTLPKGDYLFESLAWDGKQQKFLVGSAREGKIYHVDKAGKLEAFIKPDANNGLWSVYAMAVDAEHDLLYVASTASVYFKGFKQEDYGRAGVFKFRLSTGQFVDKYILQADGQPRTLSSVVINKDGRIFTADGIRNEIYKLDTDGLKILLKNPNLTSLRGLAASGDGKYLYFADYQLGLLGIDLNSGTGFDVKYNAEALALGGIDGLYWYEGALVAIENGMSPKRVMRLTLSDDGHAIVKVMALDAGNAAFTLPTYGTVANDSLYFIANSQKNEYGQYGLPNDEAKLQAVQIFKSDLRFNASAESNKPNPTIITAPPAQPNK